MDLKVKAPTCYGDRSPPYNLPREIGCFSLDAEMRYFNDDHQMKYLVMPKKLTDLSFDLNDGYSEYISSIEDEELKFHKILKWIISHEEQVRKHFPGSDSSDSKIDFVCSRGLLTVFASTIYENANDWEILATKYRSVIYLHKIRTEQKIQGEEALGERGKRMTSWGFKFEQYMTSDTMHSRPNTSVPVNENEKYHTILKVKLDNHRMLVRAEIDAVDPEHFKDHGHDPSSTLRYVELKTSKIIENERQMKIFLRYKFLKWYFQSYFAGVPKVICGFRDNDGIVRKVAKYNVRDMPKMAEGLWSPAPCLNFCSELLNYLKKCVVKDDPRAVYRIYWKPGSDITSEELSPEYQFVPDWYIERVQVI